MSRLQATNACSTAAATAGTPLACYLVGIVVSMVSGLLAIRLVKFITNRGNFRPFVVYCTLVGTIAVVASLIMMV